MSCSLFLPPASFTLCLFLATYVLSINPLVAVLSNIAIFASLKCTEIRVLFLSLKFTVNSYETIVFKPILTVYLFSIDKTYEFEHKTLGTPCFWIIKRELVGKYLIIYPLLSGDVWTRMFHKYWINDTKKKLRPVAKPKGAVYRGVGGYLIYRKLPTGTSMFFRPLPQLKGC